MAKIGPRRHENRKPILIDEMLQLKESCCSFHNQDYDEKMEELQSYVDMVKCCILSSKLRAFGIASMILHVKRFTRPGCSAETLDVALNWICSLVDALSAMSSKQHKHILHASL
ncbi:uncharacterized protein LOC121752339 isoform X3 [Salvia splendens]|uniref:uncharacterized protein LOC121752339 isoform X3 n=1 Tax=Salvia splendens TaxID=180675 RepID=UPI001C27F4A9|nr:uncharacterized protein LOC121752339 isoform X3 [Salvia splendens]XP_042003312.1 uncharacterized protein LOC121752339 isoform X3 [Salvia splendens]XP_042003321.1 uncharacterized protein LOC121752339 isoform X3 [Salvia splendens]XP_042003329.1 uncharacterized protein LOC121752339 isoform X3 [Salvia splendens]